MDDIDELSWPFIGSHALAAKAIPERAMRKWYQPVYPDVYVPRGAELTAEQRARAAWLWSGGRAVLAGQSAAALLGAKWVDPLKPAEFVSANRRPPPLIVVHSDTLLPDEVTNLEGIAVTNAARTAFDIGRRTQRLLAVQRLDALANATDLKTTDVDAVIARHKGARGIRRLRRILSLVDGGSESPRESRTRFVLIDAGLPKPETQIRVSTSTGTSSAASTWAGESGSSQSSTTVRSTGPILSSAVATSRDSLELADCGWIIVRVSNEMLRHLQGTLVARVVAALRSSGWSPDAAPSVNLATLHRRVA